MNIEYPHTQAEIDSNAWEEITEETYHYYLGVLPPAYQSGGAFAVGEALTHMNDGRVVYTTCAEVDGEFYAKPYPGDAFDAARIVAEIRKQQSGIS